MNDKTSENRLVFDGLYLSIDTIIDHINNPDSTLEISDKTWSVVERSSQACDEIVRKNIPCYGINRGFGEMVDVDISPQHIDDLQKALVLSHAVGVNEALPQYLSRTIFLLRLHSLAQGASGIRPSTLQYLLSLYNQKAYPEIYRSCSLGASGDLGPLSHLAAFAIGEGWGYLEGQRLRAREILARLDMRPLKLARKEGLSLINGTSAMVAIGLHALSRIKLYFEMMLLGMAMFADSQRIRVEFLTASAFDLKPHPGGQLIVAYLNDLLQDAQLADHSGNNLFQQVYSIRCVPFILAPLVDSLESCARTLTIEANAVSDNPVFVGDETYPYHGGHFHGMPVSVSLDQLRIALVHLSGIMDRQLEFYIDKKRNTGVNRFFSLDPKAGHCGIEGGQYLITSLHIENKVLANSFSTQVVPTNAGNQDYVSMGMQSALNTLQMAENLKHITGLYLYAALQAYSLKDTGPTGNVLKQAVIHLSNGFDFPYRDSELLSEQIEAFAKDSRFRRCLETVKKLLPDLPVISL